MRTLLLLFVCATTAQAADYPVLFLAHPHDPNGGRFRTQSITETGGPYDYHPGTDLMVLEPDGGERVLVQGVQGDLLAVHDCCMSLDGSKVYYSHIGKDAGGEWCDLYAIPLEGGTATRLTDARNEWDAPSGYFPKPANRFYVWNQAPCDTPDGLLFTSNRNQAQSPGEGYTAHMLFRMDHDGSNVEKIGHMNLGGAAHPTLMPDGRVAFSTGEQQGLRTSRGNGWAIWSINPDGSDWRPEITVAEPILKTPLHFQTVTTDGTLVSAMYYDTKVYGTLFAAPQYSPSPFDPPTPFGSPLAHENPGVHFNVYPDKPKPQIFRYAWERRGAFNPLPWTHPEDRKSIGPDGTEYGAVQHPMAVPGNGVLLTWTGRDERNHNLGVYLLPDLRASYATPEAMTKVVDLPDRHEWSAFPAVPWKAIHGSDPPKIARRMAKELPPGSPYGVIGSSNVFWNEIVEKISSRTTQRVVIPKEEIKYIRVLAFNPTTSAKTAARVANGIGRITSREGFHSSINERTGFYEPLIPVEADGSFKAIVPADQPWSFQLLNAKYEALATAQTWHQVRPGEDRTDCRGCHAHNQPAPENFEDTIAGQPDYATPKLDSVRFVEYYRDIQPIDERLTLNLGPRPWDATGGPKAYESAKNAADDDPRLTGLEARLLREWQDSGFLAAGLFTDGEQILPEHQTGPYADVVPPTLNLVTYADRTLIGACDPQSGLNPASLSVKCSEPMAGREAGAELADLFTRAGDVWRLDHPATGTLTVSIRDNQQAPGAEAGNLTKIVRVVSLFESPEEPGPEPEVWTPANLGPPFMGDDALRVRNGLIEARQ